MDTDHVPTIRPIMQDDVDAVARLWYRSWHHTYPEMTHPTPLEEWPDRVRNLPSSETVLVAEVQGHLAAFMALSEPDSYLHYLYVDPVFHGQGIGGLLLARAIEMCPNGLSLHCVQSNTRAREFYERRGFASGDEGVNSLTGLPNIAYHWTPKPS